MSVMRGMALTLVLSLVLGALGVWGGAAYVKRQMQRPTPLHELVHEKLNLTADQKARLEGIERDHEVKRRALEAEMKAANAELARAFQQQHAYTPEVQAAIDRFHHAMGELQKETMVHTLAMRSVLTPQQTAKFDETVVQSLTQDAR
ncbi:MAG: periplasmic heavy metal sensor [Phenylobacterium sp.]|uniref:Spy/CpxP family protein refolding chaperone n=1 Tax=Phenylobacterium sp. TaxID=1871053 RepID=UPI001A4C6EE0|nr:periplasmic heavy metal sensor [Phenylobacterium sp.]MBL8552879.1 periplasmic heavy metal sensor [Phenylobacterium sp.]